MYVASEGLFYIIFFLLNQFLYDRKNIKSFWKMAGTTSPVISLFHRPKLSQNLCHCPCPVVNDLASLVLGDHWLKPLDCLYPF